MVRLRLDQSGKDKMENRPPVVTIETASGKDFETTCAQLHEAGYTMKACNVGFVNSEQYDFCASYMAIWVDAGVCEPNKALDDNGGAKREEQAESNGL